MLPPVIRESFKELHAFNLPTRYDLYPTRFKFNDISVLPTALLCVGAVSNVTAALVNGWWGKSGGVIWRG